MMQKVFDEEATAVVFTCAALQYLERKEMGEMQTVYHDWLQMSFCGQCTLLWKWFGQWKKEEKYNKDKKGKWESLLVFLTSGPTVVCNGHDGNWSPREFFVVSHSLGESVPVPFHPAVKPPFDCPLPRRTALTVHPNILNRVHIFHLNSSCSALSTICLSRPLICRSIKWGAMLQKSIVGITAEKELV